MTIPRHLRDLAVTEYGVADLRGKSDEDTLKALIEIADARFQPGLVSAAQRAGKLAPDYRIPDAARANTPQRLDKALAPFREQGLFPEFPFGSDFTPEELRLIPALQVLKARSSTTVGKLTLFLHALLHGKATKEMEPLLQRMGLDQPKNMSERLTQRLLALALKRP